MKKICHLTSAHKQDDVRIFVKECSSLANYYDTHLVVVNGFNDVKNGVTIHSVNVDYNSRIGRFTKAVDEVYKKAIEIDAEIYHFHDPELLRIATKLKKKGKKVIYDAHEDFPKQILSKHYLNKYIAQIISFLIGLYEDRIVKKLDGVLTATPFIKKKFDVVHSNSCDINNFPVLSELEIEDNNEKFHLNHVCYIGGISEIRGINQIMDALGLIDDVNIELAGNFSPDEYKKTLQSNINWNKVNYLGQISREESIKLKKRCFAGLVTFLPVENHINAQPNKIFEYMAAGISVVGSNFPLWKEIIEKNKVGICVDPTDHRSISEAINYLRNNPIEASEMGKRGKELVKTKYNWKIEEEKLLKFYQLLLDD